MTNSAPKLNDKVERQGSPNTGGKRHHRSSMKSSPFFHSSGGRYGKNGINNNNNSTGRLSCSPPCSGKSSRNSPLRYDSSSSPRGSPTNSFYAGAKFSEPPSPASLPKPPSHWTNNRLINSCQRSERRNNNDISNHLKMILNVQA
ncbi:proline-rich nuclear receptor coactivator 2-like [Vespa mandarinia]|uniref:proline-rich nuclear receptor coactivator 2-like n=1 Tax=Vespa mandarinia TaxID=7446 RepID=UPI00161566A0|nr:proline-rich nuclear receptor coactivator 2-like [Vespa mandarinia]XP_046816553.1 proline-rich nuclear receptor coactivator 2-like [Vespa crabro]